MDKLKILLIMPVYDDWESLRVLTSNIDQHIPDNVELDLLVVNDASLAKPDISDSLLAELKNINDINILHLNCNLGHQKAITIGLAHIVNEYDFDAAIIMDSDGEDDPVYIKEMLSTHNDHQENIIIARRDERSEGIMFKLGYFCYKLMFRFLTGETISFGNYCLIPRSQLNKLIYKETLWSHIASTILRSGLPLTMLPTKRSERYAGEAKMNFSALVLLGLSAIAVFSDVVLLRTLFVSFFLCIFSMLSIAIVFFIKLFTALAIPGWASSTIGIFTIIFIQSIMISIFILFIILANKSNRMFIPAKHYKDFILKIEKWK